MAIQKYDRVYWQQKAVADLPPEEDVLARNAAITGIYATWYTDYPEVLKWAGMAAFASHRVGLALKPYCFKLLENTITDIEETETDEPRKKSAFRTVRLIHGGKESVINGLNLIRWTNNRVFGDIGWAHMAYLSPEGGLAALEATLVDQPDYAKMLEGFRKIDQGRQLLDGPAPQKYEAQQLIWDGNELLLEHEQLHTVQNEFEKLDAAFDLFLSFATVMSFNAPYFNVPSREIYVNPFKLSSFRLFLWLFGLGLLARTRSRPNIVRADHRWYWVRHKVLPLWKWVETKDKTLPHKMEKLKRGARL
jgi:hypothetical protein